MIYPKDETGEGVLREYQADETREPNTDVDG